MSAKTDDQPEHWTEIIEPKTRLLDLRLGELWRYRDLVLMFVRRDFVANYKQTILGPIWFFLQPLLTTFLQAVLDSIYAPRSAKYSALMRLQYATKSCAPRAR